MRCAVISVLSFLFLSGCASAPAAQTWSGAIEADRERMKALVAREAPLLGVPVSLALAVAHAESYFDRHARSSKGAVSVMQVMPSTAWNDYGIGQSELWQPQVNVRLGLHYLRRMLTSTGGRADLALSLYHSGRLEGSLPRARVHPASAAYVERVLTLEQRYRRQLDHGWPSVQTTLAPARP